MNDAHASVMVATRKGLYALRNDTPVTEAFTGAIVMAYTEQGTLTGATLVYEFLAQFPAKVAMVVDRKTVRGNADKQILVNHAASVMAHTQYKAAQYQVLYMGKVGSSTDLNPTELLTPDRDVLVG